jgi:hypothetical protein
MRLPVEPAPPAEPVEDLYAIRRRGPAPRVGQVVARTLPPLLIPTQRRTVPALETPSDEVSPPVVEHAEWREGEDRRRLCRRVVHVPVLLDTRSGEDRRRHARRDDDPVTGVDKEV